MLDTDLVAYLSENLPAVGERVFTGNADEDTPRPYIVVNRFSGVTPSVLGGTRLFSRATFKIDCVGDSYPTALPLANSLRDLVHKFTGLMGETPVESCRCLSEPTPIDVVNGDFVLRVLQQDFFFVYRS